MFQDPPVAAMSATAQPGSSRPGPDGLYGPSGPYDQSGPSGPYGPGWPGVAQSPGRPPGRRRRRLMAITAAGALTAGAGSAWALTGGGGPGRPPRERQKPPQTHA